MTSLAGQECLGKLREHRPLLLACEAIGWLHMTGKAHPDFLRRHGSTGVLYDEKNWHQSLDPDWSTRLGWLRSRFTTQRWPSTFLEFLQEYDNRDSKNTLVGFLQAGHAMASGVEKNLPTQPSKYLGQDATHMWLASPFGHPIRNLLSDPPEVLTQNGWAGLTARIGALLDGLSELGDSPPSDLEPWWRWRQEAIGPEGWLRQAFMATLAETRLPNNDVTLWDQSYVAAALFKSAVAGSLLSQNPSWESLKSQTRWRVLTVGFGTDHYEARAVRIGDWAGARRQIEAFFEDIRRLIEVDLAIGSLVFRDNQLLVFTFPGLRFDEVDSAAPRGSLDDSSAETLRQELEKEIDELAKDRSFETPPLCRLSTSTRSLIPMTAELRGARQTLAVPMHRSWSIPQTDEGQGHVCPVCQVRFNGGPEERHANLSKQRACRVCSERRKGRLDSWLASGNETIWISEVADENDRLALLTLSFDLGPWLDGSQIDCLRTQNVREWRRHNPTLNGTDNPVDIHRPHDSIVEEIERFVRNPVTVRSGKRSGKLDNPLLASLNEGFSWEDDIQAFFQKIVEDRSDAPSWDSLTEKDRAHWLAHQLFRKNASPGRIYRFWRTTQRFFDQLLPRFREIASAAPNRWRTRRLALTVNVNDPDQAGWEDRQTYLGSFRGAPFEVLYRSARRDFVTICNLSRLLGQEESEDLLIDQPIEVAGDDGKARTLQIASAKTAPGLGSYAPILVLEQDPERFRILLPLSAVNACIEAAVEKWEQEFSRVWGRMPLRVSAVAFARRTPFQAVVEAARNVEDAVHAPIQEKKEAWRVVETVSRGGMTALSLARPDGEQELAVVPACLPDGRADVFYPYLEVADGKLRQPRDFATPKGIVYRHVADLALGDRIQIAPARFALLFLESTAGRFEPVRPRYLSDWKRLRSIWSLLRREAPSITALRRAWSILVEVREDWDGPAADPAETRRAWVELARPVLAQCLEVEGAVLETLVDAAASGILELTLDWHLRALKESVEVRR
ncbi:conserved protein of unknown function [Methylacidimicrobium sp. AP8]|uniref:CRISPR-associated protein Csx11 n=1 Tax=Methylacidimicrobium sp. AP8 TaxID=2730359 RepID=UPI0018C0EA5F|nr:CRISPR-associated protein Csx11 [Methylacidimicrobium sp. AP8]CAB4243741.1 conserved protein of unknown function [Methylacidimicrobium sp. AP8]